MIHWWNTDFGKEEADNAHEVVLSGYLNEGKKTRELEARFAEIMGCKYAHMVPNGTLALATALWAVGIKPGDEVIVPDITFIATASAVHMVGAKPILCDVREEDMNIDPASIRKVMNPNVKAIAIVHINGRCCDISELQKIKDEFKLPIIEDTAQGLGSINKKHLGTFFDVGSMSLAPSKVISAGQGGVVFTNDSKTSEMITRLKDHGRMSRTEDHHPMPGYNLKFTDLQASVCDKQLDRLPARLKKAKEDYDYYQKKFDGLDGIKILPFNFEAGEVPLWIDFYSGRRDELFAFLEKSEIFPRPVWGCLHHQWIGGEDKDFPVSTKIGKEAFWLPSGPILSKEDRETVANKVLEFFGSN